MENEKRYIIREEDGRVRCVHSLTIDEKGNYSVTEYGDFNKDMVGLRKNKGHVLIEVTEDNWEEVKNEWIDYTLEDAEKKVHLIPTPSKLRTFVVGEEVTVGCLDNCVVEKVFYDGRILAISYDGDVKPGMGRANKQARMVGCWYPHNVDKKNIQRRTECFSSGDMMTFDFRKMTVESILSQMYFFGIDMEPDYQRGYVWTDEDKEKLIDSIFKGIEIGKIALIKRDYSQDLMYEVLDGKQRIGALIDFVTDRFQYKGFFFSELSGLDRNYFKEKFQVPVATIDRGITEKQKIQYFIALNTMGKVMDAEHINMLVKKLETL